MLQRTLEVAFHIEMCRHWNAVTPFDSSIAKNVVDVTMRIDSHQWLEAVAIDEAKKLVFLIRRTTTWVDDDTFARFGINDICVFREGVEDKGFEFEHIGVFI